MPAKINTFIIRLFFIIISSFDFILQFLEYHEKRRYNKQQSDCTDKHSANYSRSQGMISIGTGTTRIQKRQHSKQECQHGHQYRAKSHLGGRKCGILNRHPLAMPFRSIFCNKDGRFGKQADNHYHTCLQVNVILDAEHLGKKEASKNAERTRQNHSKRYKEPLKQCAEYKIYQHDANYEDQHRTARRRLFPGHSSKFIIIAFREHLFCDFSNSLDNFT